MMAFRLPARSTARRPAQHGLASRTAMPPQPRGKGYSQARKSQAPTPCTGDCGRDRQIRQANRGGVDLNAEAMRICQLSLWDKRKLPRKGARDAKWHRPRVSYSPGAADL